MSIEQLNNDHGITEQLKFIEGNGGLTMIEVNHAKAKALISLHAGQVLSFQPNNEADDLMFLSNKAYYQSGKAIKGGAPICWPWFGADPEGLGRPGHGFVRNRAWNVVSTGVTADGNILVTLGLEATDETKAIWPHSFVLTQEITIGDTLNLALITRNTGTETFPITQAFHTYFRVGDINQATVLGLEDCNYIDKVDNGSTKQQTGAVTISGEVDRVYLDVKDNLVIDDAALKRRIQITSKGNTTAVVWNPWAKIATAMADLQDDDYQNLLCVETTNAESDIVQVAPGNSCRLEANYRIVRD